MRPTINKPHLGVRTQRHKQSVEEALVVIVKKLIDNGHDLAVLKAIAGAATLAASPSRNHGELPSDGQSGPFLSPEETSQLLGVRPKTLANWRSTGIPQLPFSKLGNRVVYNVDDVKDFLRVNRRLNTSAVSAESAGEGRI